MYRLAGRVDVGTCLLREHLGVRDPFTFLATCHPPGDGLHRLARALQQTAIELDDAYTQAQQAGRELRTPRGQPSGCPGETSTSGSRITVLATKVELAIALERCEAIDTALIRLLAAYLDIRNSVRFEAHAVHLVGRSPSNAAARLGDSVDEAM